MKISGVLLDRDGVLNPHIPGGYLLSAEALVILPGVSSAVRRLNDAGLPVAVISNQQGVGKGLMTLADLIAIERRMQAMLWEEAGATVDRYYYCTDLDGTNSQRRKPNPGMLWEAAADLSIPAAEFVFAGDSPTDIQAGHAAGVGATILLLSGATSSYTPGDLQPSPDLVFPTLTAAADWIMEQTA